MIYKALLSFAFISVNLFAQAQEERPTEIDIQNVFMLCDGYDQDNALLMMQTRNIESPDSSFNIDIYVEITDDFTAASSVTGTCPVLLTKLFSYFDVYKAIETKNINHPEVDEQGLGYFLEAQFLLIPKPEYADPMFVEIIRVKAPPLPENEIVIEFEKSPRVKRVERPGFPIDPKRYQPVMPRPLSPINPVNPLNPDFDPSLPMVPPRGMPMNGSRF